MYLLSYLLLCESKPRSAATHFAKTLLAMLVLTVLFTLASSPSFVFLTCALLLAGAVAVLKHAEPDFKANIEALEQSDEEDEEDEEEGSEVRYR
jgi:apolipoprotein N-acyltransferase